MLNWVIKPYNQLSDMTITVTELIAQMFLLTAGAAALTAICYGIIKLIIRNR